MPHSYGYEPVNELKSGLKLLDFRFGSILGQAPSFLHHILDETQFLIENLDSINLDQFLRDPVLQRAVIRSLEIIGEAVKNIPTDLQKKYPDVEWRKMAATRNRLIHGYFSVDFELVWDIIEHKIPNLQKQIKEILNLEKG